MDVGEGLANLSDLLLEGHDARLHALERERRNLLRERRWEGKQGELNTSRHAQRGVDRIWRFAEPASESALNIASRMLPEVVHLRSCCRGNEEACSASNQARLMWLRRYSVELGRERFEQLFRHDGRVDVRDNCKGRRGVQCVESLPREGNALVFAVSSHAACVQLRQGSRHTDEPPNLLYTRESLL